MEEIRDLKRRLQRLILGSEEFGGKVPKHRYSNNSGYGLPETLLLLRLPRFSYHSSSAGSSGSCRRRHGHDLRWIGFDLTVHASNVENRKRCNMRLKRRVIFFFWDGEMLRDILSQALLFLQLQIQFFFFAK